MLVVRLTRVGKKNSPAYRVVVAEKSRAVKRKFIEIVGHYNPTMKPKEIVVDKERALFWLERGAQPSDTVRNLMVDLGILGKDQKSPKKYAKVKPVAEAENAAPAAAKATKGETEAPATEEAVDESTTPEETAA